MSPIGHILWWIAFIAGLVGTALFCGLETGIYRLNRVKLEVRAERGPSQLAALILRREIGDPQRTLATVLIGTILCGDLAAQGASRLLSAVGYSDGLVVLLNAALLTPIFFVFVESVPKEFFRLEADRVMYRLARVLPAARFVLTWTGVLPLVRYGTNSALNLIGKSDQESADYTGRERLATLLKDSAGERDEAAPISETQARLVDRALEFGSTSVADEMLPWSRVRAAQLGWGRATLVKLLAREPHSFIPMVERDTAGRSRVLGVIRSQDLFIRADAPVSRLMLEPARLPPRMSLRDAIVRLSQAAAPIGIVEEAGRPIGLVSMADLMEPLLRGDDA